MERGHERIIAALLEKGADPKIKNAEAKTAVEIAHEQIRKREKILEMISPARTGNEQGSAPNGGPATPFGGARGTGSGRP